jgi:hypothetical protein
MDLEGDVPGGDAPRRVFTSDRRRRMWAIVVAVGWVAFVAGILLWWQPLELVHVFGVALATLGIAEYVLSAWRWRLEVLSDDLVVTPTMGTADRIPRSQVVGVDEPATSPPTIVLERTHDLVLPAGTHHHLPALRDLLGTVPGREAGEVPPPPGPLRTLKGLVVAPNATLRSFAHHPRPVVAVALLAVISALVGWQAAEHWARGEQFLAITPRPGASPPTPTAAIVVGAVIGPALHALQVALFRLVARLFGGEGRYAALYSSYAPALLPVIFAMWFTGSVLASIAGFYALMLVIVAVQETERLSRWRAATATILAALVVPISLLVIALLFGEPQEARAVTAVAEGHHAGWTP